MVIGHNGYRQPPSAPASQEGRQKAYRQHAVRYQQTTLTSIRGLVHIARCPSTYTAGIQENQWKRTRSPMLCAPDDRGINSRERPGGADNWGSPLQGVPVTQKGIYLLIQGVAGNTFETEQPHHRSGGLSARVKLTDYRCRSYPCKTFNSLASPGRGFVYAERGIILARTAHSLCSFLLFLVSSCR